MTLDAAVQAKSAERSFKKLGDLANVFLFGVAAVAGIAFLWAVFDYEHYREAPSILRFVLFVLTPAFSLAMVAFARRANPLLRVKAAFVAVILFMGVYLSEAFFTWGDALDKPQKTNGRTKLEEVLAQRENGVDAHPSIHPQDFLNFQEDETYRCKLNKDGEPVLPLGGISNTTTVVCNEGGEYLIYESDEHGMHNPAGTWDTEELKVLALGDSFTQGWCVMSNEGYVALIRDECPATMNLGMAGNGPMLLLASLLEFAPQYRPQHVLWFHCENNDFHELEKEQTSDLLMRYLNEDFIQGLLDKQPWIDQEAKAIVEANIADRLGRPKQRESRIDVMSFAKLVRTRRRMGLAYDYGPIEGDYELFQRILEKAQTTVESWGGTLHLVYLPWSHRYSQLVWTKRDAEPRNEVLRITKELQIPVIDVHPEFAKHPDPLSLFIGHYTAEGNQIVADTVLSSLRE